MSLLQRKLRKNGSRNSKLYLLHAEPVNSIDKVAADPQIAARGMITGIQHGTSGDFKLVNNPIKLSRTPCNIEKASPGLGEDIDKVLKELLSMTEREIDDLRKSAII